MNMMQPTKTKTKTARTARRYTLGELTVLFPLATEEVQKRVMAQLARAKAPRSLGGRPVPADLNTLSYGVLSDLHMATQAPDPVAETLRLLTGLTPTEAYTCDVFDVFGFISMVRAELERINDLFAAVKVNYSSEELSAGVGDLDFGPFGVLDWYARRMGITNQNEVRDVAWVRIYNCMKNDVAQNNYERKLQKQYNAKRNGRRK